MLAHRWFFCVSKSQGKKKQNRIGNIKVKLTLHVIESQRRFFFCVRYCRHRRVSRHTHTHAHYLLLPALLLLLWLWSWSSFSNASCNTKFPYLLNLIECFWPQYNNNQSISFVRVSWCHRCATTTITLCTNANLPQSVCERNDIKMQFVCATCHCHCAIAIDRRINDRVCIRYYTICVFTLWQLH